LFLTSRVEAIPTAEFEKLKELPSEDSHGGVHEGESELVPHAWILADLAWPEDRCKDDSPLPV